MKLMVIHYEYPPAEEEMRRRCILEAASPGTEIEFSIIKGDVFNVSHNYDAEFLYMLGGPQVVEKAREAEKRGFDAVLPFSTLDFGVESARCHVDIPVVGMGRASLCLAAMLATRVTVFVYRSKHIPNTRKFIREIGLENFVTSVRAVDISLKDMTAQREIVKERLVKLGKQAIEEEDAEIIATHGVSLVPVYCSAEELSREVGIPVIDAAAAGVKTAEMLVSMGLRNSRKAYPAAMTVS